MAITTWADLDRTMVHALDQILISGSVTTFLESNARKWGADFNGVDGIVIRNYVPTGLQEVTNNSSEIVDAQTEAQTYKLEQKRSFVKAIEKYTNMSQNYALNVSNVVAMETKGGLIPELDAYRINSIYKQAPKANVVYSKDLTVDGEDVLKDVKRTASKLRAKIGTSQPIICYIKSTLWDLLTESPLAKTIQPITSNMGITLTTEVSKLNNLIFIPVADELMGTTFKANKRSFVTNGELNYVLLPYYSAFAVAKPATDGTGQAFTYLPNVPGSTKAIVQAFFHHDCFVLKNHSKFIYASASGTEPEAAAMEKTTAQAPQPQVQAGMQVLGQK